MGLLQVTPLRILPWDAGALGWLASVVLAYRSVHRFSAAVLRGSAFWPQGEQDLPVPSIPFEPGGLVTEWGGCAHGGLFRVLPALFTLPEPGGLVTGCGGYGCTHSYSVSLRARGPVAPLSVQPKTHEYC